MYFMPGKKIMIKLYRLMSASIALTMLLLFPSCIKYHTLIKSEFPQGKKLEDSREIVYNYIRTARIYEQFSTQAIFEVLLLSDHTRKEFADQYVERRGKSKIEHKALVTRELGENKQWISFYVLADIRDKEHLSMADKNSSWTMYLESYDAQGNEKHIKPYSITPVDENDLAHEYKHLFAHRFYFKNIYLVKFPVRGLDGVDSLRDLAPQNATLALACRGSDRGFHRYRAKFLCHRSDLFVGNSRDIVVLSHASLVDDYRSSLVV